MPWQDIIALGCVAACVAYVASKGWRLLQGRASGACGGGCSSCPAGQANEASPQFVPLDTLRDSAAATEK